MRKYIFAFIALVFASSAILAQSTTCQQLQPFCTSTIYTYPAAFNPSGATSASTINPGNQYGCLTTQPNPVWYYLQIDQPGNLQITLTNSNNRDVDFIAYGPFTSLAQAQSRCGSYTYSTTICIPLFSTCPGGSPCTGTCYSNGVVDCSYDPQATEVVDINNAQTGQVYVLLITNFSNQSTTITAQKTGGTATTDCSIVNPTCIADAGVVQGNKNIDLCADDNAITLSTQTFVKDTSSPRDIINWGVWLLADPNNVVNPQNPGPIPNDKNPLDDANFIGVLAAKGASIPYAPTGDGATYYVAPLWVDSVSNVIDSCTGLNPPQGYTIYNNPPLSFTQSIIGCDVNITLSGGYPSVNAAGVYSWSYVNPQGNTITGTGPNIVFTAPTSGVYTFSITNDGKSCDLLDFLVSNLNCNCPDFAGTQTNSLFAGAQSNDIAFLCFGDSLQVTHNQNAIVTGDGDPTTAPGIEYAVYTCPPSVTGFSQADILGDPCLLVVLPSTISTHLPRAQNNGNTTIANNGSYQDILGNRNSAQDDNPVQVWFAPITVDNKAGGAVAEGIGSPDECINVNISNAIPVVFLNPIRESGVNNTLYGSPCDASFVLNGGLPQWDSSNYTITVALQGNPSVTGTVYSTPNSVGDSVKFNVPQQGVYVITVSDGKSCDLQFTITMNCNVCDANAGTLTTTPNNFICFGDTFAFVSNGDYSGIFEEETLNDFVNLGGDGDQFNGMAYGLFDAPPLNVNPLTNANFLGVVSSDPPTKGAAPQGAGLVNTTGGNTVYYLAPVYLFDASNDSSANNLIVALDLDGDGTADCFHVNSAASVQIVFLDSITVNTPVIACNTANGSFDVTVSASGGKPAFDGSSFTFQIGNQSGQAANNATYTFTNVASTTGEFTLTVFDEAGCPKAFTYPLSQIIGNATVTSNYNGYNVSCYGFNDGTATANAIGSGNYNYAWSDGSTSQSVSGLYGNRTYTVTITDANDPDVCPFISSVSLTQPDSAYLYISPSDTSIYTGKQVQLNSVFGPLASSTIVSYTWTPSTGLSCSDCPNPVFDGTVDTNLYVLNVVYLNGCEISTSAVVYVIDDRLLYALPTAFSPNGDGKNDVFKVILNKEVSSFAMRIYNRWGEKVFESTDAKLGWDGRYKGAMQPTEVYVCYFTITKFDGEVIHQETSFSLLR